MSMLDERQRYIVQAAHLGLCPSAITQRRQTIAKRARQFWGDEVLADVQAQPLWRRQVEKG